MYKKKYMIFCLFILIVITTFVTSNVLARYIGEKGADGAIGDNPNDLPYDFENAFEVSSEEALFSAVQYGYSHIRIAADTHSPLIMDDDIAVLSRSMILDLNGIEIQRNSRSPMLTISEGATLTITDTSEKRNGGLYNPVGSVLSVDGGNLVVTDGKFEAGPRYWEYYTVKKANKNPIDENHMISVTKTDGTVAEFPAFNPNIEINNNIKKIDGNIYFDVQVGNIKPDTYCYYATSDNNSSETTNFDPKTASFAYQYKAWPNYQYMSDEEFAGLVNPILNSNYVEISIYGYEDDVALSNIADTELNPNYATIKMLKGNLTIDVDDDNTKDYSELGADMLKPEDMGVGCFINYFGTPLSSCVYLAGGDMIVDNCGAFVAVNPDDVKSNNVSPPIAKRGEGCCIITADNNQGTMTINEGVYRAYNMNCIRISSGFININGGTFDKFSTITKTRPGRAAVYVGANVSQEDGVLNTIDESARDSGTLFIQNANFRVSSSSDEYLPNVDSNTPIDTTQFGYYGDNSYALYVTSGTLDIKNSSFEVDGDYSTALYMSGGSAYLNNVSCNMQGSHLYGLVSFGGTLELIDNHPLVQGNALWKIGDNTIKDDNNKVDDGHYSYGVYADNINAISNEKANIYLQHYCVNVYGKNSQAIYSNDYKITSVNSYFRLTGDNSKGINSESTNTADGDHSLSTLRFYGGSFDIQGDNSGGIMINGGQLSIQKTIPDSFGYQPSEESKAPVGTFVLSGNNSVGLYSLAGDIISTDIIFDIHGAKSFGIYAKAGNIEFQNSSLTITNPDNCYGIIGVGNDSDKLLSIDVKNSTIVVGGTYSDGQIKWSSASREGIDPSKTTILKPANYTGNTDTYYGASIGLYLTNITESECYVSLVNSNLYSIDLGVAVKEGNVFIEEGGRIETKNSSALAVNGGNVFFGNVKDDYYMQDADGNIIDYAINDYSVRIIDTKKINNLVHQCDAFEANVTKTTYIKSALGVEERAVNTTGVWNYQGNVESVTETSSNDAWGVSSRMTSKSNMLYSFTTPEPTAERLNDVKVYNVYDGIFVYNGDVHIINKLDFDFMGIRNKEQQDGDHAKVYENSYAIRVMNGNLDVDEANIRNYCGGGISVEGGVVTLGDETNRNTKNKINIQTLGSDYGGAYNPAYNFTHNGNPADHTSWRMCCNFTGGTAVNVIGGSINLNGGVYQTVNGSAINVYSDTTDTANPSNVNVYGGLYLGAGIKHEKNKLYSGPGAYYGLKASGNVLVNIYGGDFGGGNGGLFVNGRLDKNVHRTAKVYVYEGNFGKLGIAGATTCQDAINIYEDAYAVFGAYKSNEKGYSETQYRTLINVSADVCALAINPMNGYTDFYTSTIKVYYGSYKGYAGTSETDENQMDSVVIPSGASVKVDVYNVIHNSPNILTSGTYSANESWAKSLTGRLAYFRPKKQDATRVVLHKGNASSPTYYS